MNQATDFAELFGRMNRDGRTGGSVQLSGGETSKPLWRHPTTWGRCFRVRRSYGLESLRSPAHIF